MHGGVPGAEDVLLAGAEGAASRRGQFDVVHDNQTFGSGMLGIMADGWPLLGTCHHPITVDRALDLGSRRRASAAPSRSGAGTGSSGCRSGSPVSCPGSSPFRPTPSGTSSSSTGCRPQQLAVVPIGVDHAQFRPRPSVARVPGRIMTTASADVPFKGLLPLVEAVAKVRTENGPTAHLVVVGRLRDRRPGGDLDRAVGSRSARYVSSRGSATSGWSSCMPRPPWRSSRRSTRVSRCLRSRPWRAGSRWWPPPGARCRRSSARTASPALLVPPGDAGALAGAIGRVLDDPELAARLSAAGRRRVLERYTWRGCAQATSEHYRWTIDHFRSMASGSGKAC